jgi:hypothetical protein
MEKPYENIKNERIEENAVQKPAEDKRRYYKIDILEYHRKGLRIRCHGKRFILEWRDILFMCAGAVREGHRSEVIAIDFFVDELSAPLRVVNNDIVYVGFPFRLFGTLQQNIHSLLSYIISKNFDIDVDLVTSDFIAKRKEALNTFSSWLEYEKFVWSVSQKYIKTIKTQKSPKFSPAQKYCLVLKKYNPDKEQEMIESLAIIKSISDADAAEKLSTPLVLMKNISLQKAKAIVKELAYIDASVEIISMRDYRKMRNLWRRKV